MHYLYKHTSAPTKAINTSSFKDYFPPGWAADTLENAIQQIQDNLSKEHNVIITHTATHNASVHPNGQLSQNSFYLYEHTMETDASDSDTSDADKSTPPQTPIQQAPLPSPPMVLPLFRLALSPSPNRDGLHASPAPHVSPQKTIRQFTFKETETGLCLSQVHVIAVQPQ